MKPENLFRWITIDTQKAWHRAFWKFLLEAFLRISAAINLLALSPVLVPMGLLYLIAAYFNTIGLARIHISMKDIAWYGDIWYATIAIICAMAYFVAGSCHPQPALYIPAIVAAATFAQVIILANRYFRENHLK